MNNNFNKDLIKKEINTKIVKINKEKAEKILFELGLDKLDYIDKKEIIDYILEINFDNKKIKEWIEKKKRIKAEQLYYKLIKLDYVDFSKSSKDEIIKKIIVTNFDEYKIKSFYSTIPEDKVVRIYYELEDEYGISGFTEKKVVKDKIRELKLDKALINAYIESIITYEE